MRAPLEILTRDAVEMIIRTSDDSLALEQVISISCGSYRVSDRTKNMSAGESNHVFMNRLEVTAWRLQVSKNIFFHVCGCVAHYRFRSGLLVIHGGDDARAERGVRDGGLLSQR